MTTKTECPVTRAEFTSEAKPLQVKAGEFGSTVASPRTFSTGSFGWYAGGEKITVKVGDKLVKVQVNVTLTVVNSKEVA